jgi:hypothetical protein
MALQIWEEVIKFEENRADTIKRTFNIYIIKYLEIYGQNDQMERNLKEFSDYNAKNEALQNYDIHVTIDENSLNLDGIKDYFSTFKVPEIEGNHRLI